MKKFTLLNKIENIKTRSHWMNGVKDYAIELLEIFEDYEEIPVLGLQKILLNGDDNWKQYSWGGSSLIYDYQIAERLCTPSELKKTRHGERKPNAREEWLDTQARALYQAYRMILENL